jgi:branched-subunit amino acid ABC-type transport system permease component
MSIGRAVDVGLSSSPVISGRRWRRAAVVLVAAMLPASVSGLGGGFGNVACYLLLLAMLMVRPQGMFGRQRPKRV